MRTAEQAAASCALEMSSARSKYRAKSLKEKVEILQEVDAGKESKVEIAKKHGTPKSTLSTYIKNKRTIEDAYEAEVVASDRKRLRLPKYPELEQALVAWIKDMRSRDLPMSGPIVIAKAGDFALWLNCEDFALSEGWFHRFRERHELTFRTVSGEGSDVSAEMCITWKNGALTELLASYAPCDIFNADETALLFFFFFFFSNCFRTRLWPSRETTALGEKEAKTGSP